MAEPRFEREEMKERTALRQQVEGGQEMGSRTLLPVVTGFGDSVDVEDLETRARDTYTLMTGPLLDFEAGQVSLASPIGQSLLGATVGDTVEIRTPQRLRLVRVLCVRPLRDELLLETPERYAG